MTVEFFTGFEGCGTIGEIRSLLSTSGASNLYNATNGFAASKCIRSGHVSNGWFTKTCVAAKTKTVGFFIRGCSTNAYSSTTAYCLMVFQGANIRVYNTASGLDIRSGTTALTTHAYYIGGDPVFVEIKLYSHATLGTFQMKVNGRLLVDLADLNTSGNDITGIYFGTTNKTTVYFDNIYIAEDFQGELRSYLLLPSADGVVAFTPQSGTDNYAMIDETAHDSDTTYVESNTLNHQDLYDFTDVPVDAVIKGVTIVSVARKLDAGARDLQHIAKQGATEYDLDAFTLATTYPASASLGLVSFLDVAPDNSAWTPAILNALQIGFKIST